MKQLLRVSYLKKYFSIRRGGLVGGGVKVTAVDDVSFDIKKGETLGLVGESGSGKTTIGRCILRLIQPSSGAIFFENRDITAFSQTLMKDLRRDMQIIFQDPYGSLTPRLKVSALLSEPLKIHGVASRSERMEMVCSILKKVGLKPEHMHRYPHEFSGGQRQRISIARAIILNPKLIIADEPVSALDVSIRAQILNLLAEIQQEFDLSYLFISHDLSIVKYMSDRIAVMYLGKIMETANRDDLYSNPGHPYTVALLSAIPLPRIRKKGERIVLTGEVPSPIKPPEGCGFHTRCAYIREECEKIEPELKDLGNGHLVACHLR